MAGIVEEDDNRLMDRASIKMDEDLIAVELNAHRLGSPQANRREQMEPNPPRPFTVYDLPARKG